MTGPSDVREDEGAVATYFPGCSPVDGPAVDLLIVAEPLTCEQAADFPGPESDAVFTRVSLYGTVEPDMVNTHAVGSEVDAGSGYSSGGWGYRCDASGHCVNVQRGSITFLRHGEPGQTVEASLLFEDGTRQVGRYPAQACERVVFCG